MKSIISITAISFLLLTAAIPANASTSLMLFTSTKNAEELKAKEEAKTVRHDKQEKMVKYMQTVNRDLDTKVAHKLADAMLIQSAKHGIPVEIQLSIVRRESRYDQFALGELGELGFFQLMVKPHTGKVFKMLKAKEISTRNLYDPYTQATVAMAVLNDCLSKKKRDMNKSLACYNGAIHPGEYSTAVLEKANAIKKLLKS